LIVFFVQIVVIIPLSPSQKLSIVAVKKGGTSRVRSEFERTKQLTMDFGAQEDAAHPTWDKIFLIVVGCAPILSTSQGDMAAMH
jgi:hypothetical protein